MRAYFVASERSVFSADKGVAICNVCNVLHGWSREVKSEQQNNTTNPKKQCSCRLSGFSENGAFERCR